MKSSTNTSSLELEELVNSIDPEFTEELLKAKGYSMEDKASVLKLAKKLLVECDYVDEEICTAIDYLQCQVDHLKNLQEVLPALQHQERFTGEFGDLRYIVHEIRY